MNIESTQHYYKIVNSDINSDTHSDQGNRVLIW